MEVSVAMIAQLVKGTVDGDPTIKINRPSRIEEGGEGSISFYGNPKYEAYVYTTDASALLVQEKFQPKHPIQATLIRVKDVYAAIAILLDAFGQQEQVTSSQISEKAAIDNSAKLGKQIIIGAFSIIKAEVLIGDQCQIHDQVYVGENVKLGKNVILYPGVKIMKDCIIGDHCIIHSNTVIGSDGFGFAPQEDGTYKKIAQVGNVILEDRVEIGSNCSIDRGSIGATLIRRGVKLDNLIQIAHNVEIGENTVIAAQTGIAGSTKIGKNCQIGGQVGFVGHIKIADGTRIQAQSGIMANLQKPGAAWFGSPAIPYRDYLKAYAIFKRLPALITRLKELEAHFKLSNKK